LSKEENSDVALESVYKAPDEFMAKTIESLLNKNSIITFLKSNQISMYDSIGTLMKGNWGEIFVRKEDSQEAKDLIGGFLSNENEP